MASPRPKRARLSPAPGPVVASKGSPQPKKARQSPAPGPVKGSIDTQMQERLREVAAKVRDVNIEMQADMQSAERDTLHAPPTPRAASALKEFYRGEIQRLEDEVHTMEAALRAAAAKHKSVQTEEMDGLMRILLNAREAEPAQQEEKIEDEEGTPHGEPLLEKLRVLTVFSGLEIEKASSSLTAGQVRQYSLEGQSFGLRFKLDFRVREPELRVVNVEPSV
eukprot:Colp12_sorted_trinity150504_noHs@31108